MNLCNQWFLYWIPICRKLPLWKEYRSIFYWNLLARKVCLSMSWWPNSTRIKSWWSNGELLWKKARKLLSRRKNKSSGKKMFMLLLNFDIYHIYLLTITIEFTLYNFGHSLSHTGLFIKLFLPESSLHQRNLFLIFQVLSIQKHW